jgi:S-formylglutathione hydrolase
MLLSKSGSVQRVSGGYTTRSNGINSGARGKLPVHPGDVPREYFRGLPKATGILESSILESNILQSNILQSNILQSNIELHDLATQNLPEAVPYALISPPGYKESAPLPLCLMLMGGGGSRQNLVDCQPLFETWWAEGSLPPMVLATPSPGMNYYLEDSLGSIRWDSFLVEEFIPHLRATCNAGADRLSTAITGISIGGYGALKTAFAHPDLFGVAAAMQPMLEPAFHDSEIGARNRLHHMAGGPPQLVGPTRDPALFESNNPANRAYANAALIRKSGMEIYIDAGDEDFLNAHDGAEFLHRVLWDLDISHEYHLVRGADHGGPSMRPRMRVMYTWVGTVMSALRSKTVEPTAEEQAVSAWIEGGMSGKPPAAAPTSQEFLRILRAQFQPLRDGAAAADPTGSRRYGVLPKCEP